MSLLMMHWGLNLDSSNVRGECSLKNRQRLVV